MSARFELKHAAGGQCMFNLKAPNGQVILTSESYKSKQGALDGIESVRTYAVADERYERKIAKNGRNYFVLTAPNGEMIGKSEMYSSVSAMEGGIGSVKKNAPAARVQHSTSA